MSGSSGGISLIPIGNTTTSSNSGTLANQYGQSTGQTLSTGSSTGTSSTTSGGYTSNTTSNTTVNSSNPAIVAALEALVNTATSNASNAVQNTSGVIAGLLQTAKDSFASVFGQQGQSGLYNASSTEVQENNTLARTAADAASTVLGYQTQEQGIASTALQSLLTALGTQTSTGSTLGQNAEVSNTISSGTTQNKTTSVTNTKQNTSTDTHSNSDTASTIVCTEMLSTGLLELREYSVVHRHYTATYSDHGKQAYHFWGRKIVSKLRRDRTSKVSRALLSIFLARTHYVSNKISGKPPLTRLQKTYGRFCYWLIHIICIPPGFVFLVKKLILGDRRKSDVRYNQQ